MKLKLDAQGHAVLEDGMPVYTHSDGKELPFDAVSAVTKIKELNGESMGRRQKLEEAETRLNLFDGLDPAAAKDALSKLSAIDQKKLIDAGEIEKVRAEITKSIEDRYKPIVEERDGLKGQLRDVKIDNAFNSSKYIKDNIAVPPDMFRSLFGKNVTVDDGGKLVLADANGNKIYSRTRAGEPADFDEGIEVLVSGYASKDSILKSSGSNGTGGKQSAQAAAGAKTMTSEKFLSLSQSERMAAAKDGITVAN